MENSSRMIFHCLFGLWCSVCTCACVCAHVRVHACVCVCVRVFVCLGACMHVHTLVRMYHCGLMNTMRLRPSGPCNADPVSCEL